MESWNNVGGSLIYMLKQDPRYPDKPDTTSITPNMASPPNTGDNYGLRLSAYYKVRPGRETHFFRISHVGNKDGTSSQVFVVRRK